MIMLCSKRQSKEGVVVQDMSRLEAAVLRERWIKMERRKG